MDEASAPPQAAQAYAAQAVEGAVSINALGGEISSSRGNANNEEVVDLISQDQASCGLGKHAREDSCCGPQENDQENEEKVQEIQEEALVDCPICFEPWASGGEHRVCSLACGHLFGKSCILTWLKSMKKCPSCNARAKKGDVRPIWAPKLIASDTAARDDALEKCQAEQNKRLKVEAENARLKMTLRMLQSQLASVRSHMQQPAAASAAGPSAYPPLMLANPVYGNSKLPESGAAAAGNQARGAETNTKLEYSQLLDGGRNVCFAACSTAPPVIYVSYKQGSNEHGLCKIGVEQLQPIKQYPLHTSNIKCMAYHPSALAAHGGALATVSFDRTMKVTLQHSDECVATCKLPSVGWSVSWSARSEHQIWVGGQGVVSMFDVRRPDESFLEVRMPSMQPVHSLWSCATPTFDTVFAVTGQGVFAFHGNDGHTQPTQVLTLDNSLSAARLYRSDLNPSFQQPSIEFLTCVRGDAARVGQYSLDIRNEVTSMVPRLIRNYRGHSNRTTMSKPCFIESPRGSFIAAADEATNHVRMWHHSTGLEAEILPANLSPVYDIDSFTPEGATTNLIATLCDRQLQVFSR